MNHYITINLTQMVSAYTHAIEVRPGGADLQIEVPPFAGPHGIGVDSFSGISAAVMTGVHNQEQAPLELGRLMKAALAGVEDIQLTAKPTGAVTETLADYVGQHILLTHQGEVMAEHPVFVVGVMSHIKMAAIWDGEKEAVTLLPLDLDYEIRIPSEKAALKERIRDMHGRGLDFLIDNTTLGGQHE